ncbi:MAG TPA: type II secretion system protein [Phycisphaerae bacterium]|nr:type II secretion system protein [Phycisphaerae bacterium]HPS53921.1 type II secretion system protein [Phycisphaerae bacterium]
MKKAFTLIEILIVVILLGILAAVVIPQFVDQTAVVNKNAAATEVANLNSAWQQYVAAGMADSDDATPINAATFTAACQALLDGHYIDTLPTSTKYEGWTLEFTQGATPQQSKFAATEVAAG